MRIRGYVHRYDDADVYDGDVDYRETHTLELHYGPTDMVDEIQSIIDCDEFDRMEWSSSPTHREGDWLSVSARDNYGRSDYEHCDASFHGPLAQLERLYAHWCK